MPEQPTVSIAACATYQLDAVRAALRSALDPLGGMRRYVRPGMRVLLKPNLLSATDPERGVTTHPAVMQSVAELVIEAGGTAWIGDSPGGPTSRNAQVMAKSGAVRAAEAAGADLVPFRQPAWRRLNGVDYFVAPAVVDADLVIDLPKLKTHMYTLYTGAVKNLYGVIVGTRKRDLHFIAPGVVEFGDILVGVLELVQPGLTILDGVVGIHGNGPGASGTPNEYGCIAASTDPVALDAVVARAMGYRTGEVLHLTQASERGLGISDPGAARVVGDVRALEFGPLDLPRLHWYYRAPRWAGKPIRKLARVRPSVEAEACIGCGQCVEVCPKNVIARGRPPTIDLSGCIGCLCCAEICPEGAIAPQRSLLARLIGLGY